MIDADRIAQKLWVGSAMAAMQPLHGFDVVVLCAKEFQPGDLAVQVLRVPMDDSLDVGQTEMHAGLSAARQINRLCSDGKRVMVTCIAGQNRSAFVAALCLMGRGYQADAAIRIVRAARRLPEGRVPLSNPAFVALLHQASHMTFTP
jgi:Dual specificity phosphatase, catalytic domain